MATLGSLTITTITEIDAGDYLCEARSGSESIPATEEINISINGEYCSYNIAAIKNCVLIPCCCSIAEQRAWQWWGWQERR